MALTGIVGAVYRANGVSVALTDAPTTKNGTFTEYKITDNTKRYLDDSFPITVKKNGVTITTGFTIEPAGGVIKFNPPLITTDVVTVSGKYFTMVECATMFNWKLDIGMDTKDVTTFASNGWVEKVAGVGNWTASAEGYWASNEFLTLLGTRLIMVFYVDEVGDDRYEGYVFIKKSGIDTPVDDVIKESIDIEGTGTIYFHE